MSDSGHSLSTFSGYSYHVPPAYSFSKSIRDKNHKNIPGPTDYFPTYKFYSPSYSISKSKRHLSDYRDKLPGPGHYTYSIKDLKNRFSISKA